MKFVSKSLNYSGVMSYTGNMAYVLNNSLQSSSLIKSEQTMQFLAYHKGRITCLDCCKEDHSIAVTGDAAWPPIEASS